MPVIAGVFHLTLVYNTGIAFGLLQDHGALLIVFISVSLLTLLFFCRWMMSQGPWASLSMVLILGGALGNWIDRLRVKAVIDYLDFRVFPVFNLADTAITAGVFLYFWLTLGLPGKPRSAKLNEPNDKRSGELPS